VLRGAALGAAAPLIPATASATAGRGRGGDRAARSVSFRWLGTTGWRIDVGDRTVLFDPYLTRFPTGLFGSGLDPKTQEAQGRAGHVDAGRVDKHAKPLVETVLLGRKPIYQGLHLPVSLTAKPVRQAGRTSA
jgi:hypothetical protein